jgi:tripartite-type tricarboxylate transporter receptor subunit TctC
MMFGSRSRRFSAGRIAVLVLGAAGLLMSQHAAAQQFPSKPITIIVPFAAGGASDMTARLLAKKLEESLKTNVLVDNRAGANSQIGTAAVIHAEPDGHTLLLGTTSLINNVHLYSKLPYDASHGLRPVAGVVDVPVFLAVGPKMPVADAREFIAAAKKSKGGLNYASAGAGSTLHLSAEWLKLNAGFDATHIPHRGSGPAVVALATNVVDFSLENYGPALPQMQAKRVRLLAIGGPKRFPALPAIPTFKEVGLPDVDLSSWFVLMAPAATPDGVVRKLNEHVNKILAMPDVRERLVSIGLSPLGGSPEEMQARMQQDSGKWGAIIRAAKVSVE